MFSLFFIFDLLPFLSGIHLKYELEYNNLSQYSRKYDKKAARKMFVRVTKDTPSHQWLE